MSYSTALKKNHPKLINYAIFLLNFLFAILICWGVSGGTPRLHDILLFWLLCNCFWFKPVFAKIVSPVLLIWILYAPIGAQYGYPNAGMVASLFETTANETKEFFDARTIIYFAIIIILTFFIYVSTKNINASIKQKKFFKYFSWLLAILFISNIVSFKHRELRWLYSELLNIFPHTLAQYHIYQDHRQKMIELNNLKDDWQINNFQPNYQTHVLVIGESASKNYLSAYGYPVKTSPFIDKSVGTLYNQVIAPAGYTTKSIPRLLTNPNPNHVEFQNNIITLANKANIETYWVSNQDRLGFADNEIYYVANKSQHSFYLSDLAPTSKRYDSQLLPIIDEILKSPKHKLIIVHLMGSHARFSKRVDKQKPHFEFHDDYLSHYLSSLLQTDIFLEELHQKLTSTQTSFSMIYISDHGLTPITLKHGLSQFTLQVPLFKVSNNDTERKVDNDIISGFSFIWFLTEWLGIDTENQKQNTFLNDYRLNNLSQIQIFDNSTKPYLELEPFDGKILTPSDQELSKQ